MREYLGLPVHIVNDPLALAGWMMKARAYAATLPRKKQSKTRRPARPKA
jgi:hypothetical protein